MNPRIKSHMMDLRALKDGEGMMFETLDEAVDFFNQQHVRFSVSVTLKRIDRLNAYLVWRPQQTEDE